MFGKAFGKERCMYFMKTTKFEAIVICDTHKVVVIIRRAMCNAELNGKIEAT